MVAIYLDVSCLNRPFDDQAQSRVRVETSAITVIFERLDAAEWQHVSSQMAVIEIDATSDTERRRQIRLLLPERQAIMQLDNSVFDRAKELEKLGFKAADAVHIAAAESTTADVLLTCDDRMLRLAKRSRTELQIDVANPVDWLQEQENVDP